MMENKLELKHNWKLNIGAGNPASFKLNDWLPVSVPGTVHTDLLEHKLIDEPFYNDNEAKQSWICETDWTYQTTFDRQASFSDGLPIKLVFEGLDTVGEIYLNGFRLGKCDNMFLKYEYDVTSKLKNAGNILEVRFQSPIKYGKKLEKKYGKLPVALNSERAYIRKAQYSFGWDWGPSFPTMGIWRPVYLIQRGEAYIKNFSFTTKSIKKNKAVIEIGIEAGGNVSGKSAHISLSNGQDKIEKRFDIRNKNQRFEIEMKNPKLWHPNGEGEQNLYDLKLDLLAGDKILDSLEKKAGIRTIELQLKDKGKSTFRFMVNGKHVYAKGVNWIPADSFLPRVDEKKYRKLLQYAKDANMNIVRVWGGGFYENDKFYELCDELGLLVWQDFMFACGGYPEHKEFLDNVTEEVEQNVKRLSYHPSIALWCGNNENQWIWRQDTGISYKKMPGYKIYHKLIPSLLEKLDPARPYWPSSPFGFEEDPNSPLSGNRHEWGIWSRWIDYTEVKNDNSLFVTEFGFQGPANKKTYEKFISEEHRYINSPVFEWHNKQVEGPERIMKFLSGALPVKTEWDDFIYLAQLNQGFALKTCLEHWRMNYPATNGSIIWQINDCWPVASWALIDSELTPKMVYYFVKNTFNRQVVSFSEKGDSIIINALNQTSGKDNINLAVTAYNDNTGALIFAKQVSEKIASWEKKSMLAIADKELPNNNNWTLIATLTDESKNILFRNYYSKSKWKHKKLAAPDIALSLAEENGKQYAKLTAERPAYFADLYHPEAEFSDRGFILLPNEEKMVEIISKNSAALRAEDIKIFTLNNYSILYNDFYTGTRMKVIRTNISLKADHSRVLARPFVISNEERLRKIFSRILSLSKDKCSEELNNILTDFESRHKNIKAVFAKRADELKGHIKNYDKLAQEQRLLIGAYFTMEYSVEAAALFNPSVVWHPDQTKLPAGSKRFVISLRSTGEGHISSITFRSGVIDSGNNIKLDEPTRYLCPPAAIEDHGQSDYTMRFADDTELSERILFPYAPAETNGVEDARFVQFTDDDGNIKYYATYTAYDGHSITPRILETADFLKFKVSSLKGSEVVNKGFALFPRKINGKYAMLSRQDNENNFIMFSDDLHTWNSRKMIMEPEYPWDFIQLGNCGSPIEMDAGWLVLSHGVGAMRKYSIGAFLLDKDNPERVIGRLKEPLISPNENEREGYVPNVVYSCGGLISRDELIIPYAMSDYASSFAKVGLKEIIKELHLLDRVS